MARRDFRVVKAGELEAREVVERGPLALVPLTPLMRGADEEVVRAGAHALRERGAGEEMDGLKAMEVTIDEFRASLEVAAAT